MASAFVTIRQLVYQAIHAKKLAGGFVDNDWELDWTYLPYQELKDIPPNGKVWIIGLAHGDEEALTRGNLTSMEIPVQVGFQRLVNASPAGRSVLDMLVELVEQLREVCRKEVAADDNGFSWLRTESLKDPDETPYSYMGLRQASSFETYFTPYYKTILA